ncbi:MAG: hypothetical protein FWB76_01710 [Oscillospiraceae bacterium]|nr:hypothetical protein [Oscillospiraceae bacterium]
MKKLLACLVILGLFLGACASAPQAVPHHCEYCPTRDEPTPYRGYSEFDFVIRCAFSHSVDYYVVHLAAQEVQDRIRTQLEAAGLRFNAAPPSYTLPCPDSRDFYCITLDLFDQSRNVAVSFISWESCNAFWRPRDPRARARNAVTRFAELTNTTVGVFVNPCIVLTVCDGFPPRPSPEEAAEHVPDLLAQIDAQVDDFINQLQHEGIL